MKNLVIASGNWTGNGNFSGYDLEVGRVHIFAAQMKGLGYDKDAAVSFPLFAIGAEKEFNQVDAEGNPTGEKFTRWQANGVFKTRKELVDVKAASQLIDVEVKQSVKAEATKVGLSEAEMTALLAAVI